VRNWPAIRRSEGIIVNCDLFAKILADFQEGRLRFDKRIAAEAHLEECDSCRRLLSIARGKLSLLPEEVGRELARSIIERTSGPACPRVKESLCSYVDGDLNSEDAQLVADHLDSCHDCATLAETLGMMASELPRMAEIEPDGEFTQGVLGATNLWRPFRPSLRTRFLTWWNRMIQRPRFSFEAAYVGTLLLVFAFGNPIAPFRGITLEFLNASAFQPSIRERVSESIYAAWTDADAPVLRLARAYAAGASRRERAVYDFLKSTTRHCKGMISSALPMQAKSLDGWRREAARVFLDLQSKLSTRISRSKS
jgi:anti-sigma factor RsiW